MVEQICNVPTPKTTRELEQAIERYRLGNFNHHDLFCQWQAIREGALAQRASEQEFHPIAGEDSY